MNLTGNTIFITGGGSGIGRGLAEALHRLGNWVIISGRRKGHLEATTKANPGMQSVELNVEDPASIASVSRRLVADYPKLNVLINNAGIMQVDDAAGVIDDDLLTSTVTTNLLGPIRLTSALIEHLKKQEKAAVIYNTSVDDAAGVIDDDLLTSTVTTNLLGPIRLTSALIEHLKKQEKAAVIYNTS